MWNDPFFPYSSGHIMRKHEARQVIVPPALEIVSVDEFKVVQQFGACPEDGVTDPIETASEDALISTYLTVARRYIENVKGRAFVIQTWQQVQNGFWHPIRLAPCPVQQVASISYRDFSGTLQVIDPTNYYIDAISAPALIVPEYGRMWPILDHSPAQVTIEFTAGYLTPITVNATSNVFTAQGGRTFATLNERLIFSNRGGVLPAPLVANKLYYVVNPSGATFQLSETLSPVPPDPPATALDITDTGTGTHFIGQIPEEERVFIMLLAQHLYENRLPVMPTEYYNLPWTLQNFLWNNRVLL